MLSWCGWSESKSGRSGGESLDESVSKSQSAKVHRSVRVKRVAVVVVVVAMACGVRRAMATNIREGAEAPRSEYG